jgi:hypothetical protein
MLDIALQNVTSTRFPEIRSSGFINPGAPVVLRVAVSFRHAAEPRRHHTQESRS